MSEQSSNIVSKVWGLCNPLRDDGVSYGDYLEQLTYLIFLKMSDEYSRPPYKRETGIPKGYTWSDMNTLKGAELENQYRAILERLGDEGGILGQIFKGAVNKISNVSILYRVVQMIDKENWVSMSSDVKGEIYEGLLQKNAEDVKSGAGQYFTPRPLIKAMVACLRPEPKKTIADPCCGSGGFFLAAQAFLADPKNYALDRTETWSQENPEGRWRRFTVDEILERDKTSLDIFWLKDKSLADLDNLPAPDEFAADIIENLQSALESFQELMGQLKKND